MKTLLCIIIAVVLISPPALAKGVKELEQSIQKKKGDLTEIQKELKEKKKKIKRKW